MKRRGILPSWRTYGTLLKGYSQIDDWEKHPVQLDNVCSLYDQLKQYHTEHSSEYSNIPYNLLIEIFGKAQRFQRMYDVFNDMSSPEKPSPDIHTFTVLLIAIANRKLSSLVPTPPQDGLIDTLEDDEPAPPTLNELAHKNASDAKLIWRQLLRVCGEPDSHAIRAVLKPLARGRPSDQNFALDIVHEYLGLSRPGEQALPAKLELHPHTLESLLHACNYSRRYRFTLHYVQQVIDSGRALVLAREHMDLALEAHAALAPVDSGESDQALEMLQWMLRMHALPPAPELQGGIGPQIKPTASSYDLVALACWYSGDWRNICRTFDLMTGYASDQFRGEIQEAPKPQHLRGHILRPSSGFMSSFIRTAAKTYSLDNVRLTLNILEHFGFDRLDPKRDPPSPNMSRKQEKDHYFNTSKLMEALVVVLPRVLRSTEFGEKDKIRWEEVLKRAKKYVAKEGSSSEVKGNIKSIVL
ncbi:hypothetical protein K439DRAFT_416932 [Ramaria rubella]|nr:hypothetical protein K439DRAFT_416932 [Ramaria rubella]